MNYEYDNSLNSFDSEIEEIIDNTSSENYYEEEEVTLTDEYVSHEGGSSEDADYYEESYHSSPEPGRTSGSRRESIALDAASNAEFSALEELGESFLHGSHVEDVFREYEGEEEYSVSLASNDDIVSENENSRDYVSPDEVERSAKYDADVDGSSHQSSSASSYSVEIKDESNRRWYQPPKQTPPRRIKTEGNSLDVSSTSFRSSSNSKFGDSSISSMPQAPMALGSALGKSPSSLASMRTITEHEGSHRSEASEMLSRGGTNPHNRTSPKTNRRGKKSPRVISDHDASTSAYITDDRSHDIQPSMAPTNTRQTDSRASKQSSRPEQRKQQYETRQMSPPASVSTSQSTTRRSASESEEPIEPSIVSTRTPELESRATRKASQPQRRKQQPKSRTKSPTPSAASRSTSGSKTKSCASIAVLGTMSDTGKSIIAAALCRIFTNGGTKCAPFKSQHTGTGTSPALLPDLSRRDNVYKCLSILVKKQGYENGKNGQTSTLLYSPTKEQDYGQIGTAQSLQAEACKILPRVEMNPIFFKSRGTNEKGEAMCDMIVMGKQVVRESYGALSKMVPTMKKMAVGSHRSLAAVTGAEVIVVQGAGACSELNLMDGDIVNLPLVRCLRCPWLLVANDDIGGVFAQVVGTKMCVSKSDWALCVGVIVNKVRGNTKHFLSSVKKLEKMIGKPLYAMPFVNDLGPKNGEAIDIERRIAWEKKGRKEKEKNSRNRPSVVVVAYPHSTISNDLYPLEKDKRFHLEYRRKRLPKPYPATTAIILPGSRLPLLDLKWLQDSGWADFLRKHVSAGGTVLGLGAGYQMLGWNVKQGTHSKKGIGLLPVTSTAEPAECNLKEQMNGQIYPSGVFVEGFEINCGYTEIVSAIKKNVGKGRYEDLAPLLAYVDGKPEGMRLGRVQGTYLHGILRSAKARVELLTSVSDRKQFHSILVEDVMPEDPLDKLAKHLQTCGLDHDTLRKIVFAE